jgi:hypothetical protein
LPDELLLHEMVHALRIMQGVWNPMPSNDYIFDYKNFEEFLAVVITNVYICTKRGNALLRKSYRRVGPLEGTWNTTDKFLQYELHQSILGYYTIRWQPVFGLLGDVDTPFNPFRPFRIGGWKAKPAKP